MPGDKASSPDPAASPLPPRASPPPLKHHARWRSDYAVKTDWNTNGYGWEGDSGLSTSTFHTAVGLQALKAVGYSDPTVTNSSLAYLTQGQNSDGGWGFNRGDDSNVYMTAVVSATLQQFPQMATIAAVSKATTYLLAHRNIAGGFGGLPSTVYETALAYTLVAVSGNEAALGSAVIYLTAAQAANGS